MTQRFAGCQSSQRVDIAHQRRSFAPLSRYIGIGHVGIDDEDSVADRDLITRTEYDSDGRVRWTQDAIGRKTWMVYDALGRQKKVIRNCTYTTGSPAPEDDAYVGQHASDSAKDGITRTIYDSQGRVGATIDAHNRETRFEYDVLGRRVKTIRNYVDGAYASAAPDQDMTETTVYDLAGRVGRTIDNAGQEMRFEYDLLGWRIRTISFYQDGVYSAAQPDRDLIAAATLNETFFSTCRRGWRGAA